jgi:hypothetical protein
LKNFFVKAIVALAILSFANQATACPPPPIRSCITRIDDAEYGFVEYPQGTVFYMGPLGGAFADGSPLEVLFRVTMRTAAAGFALVLLTRMVRRRLCSRSQDGRGFEVAMVRQA